MLERSIARAKATRSVSLLRRKVQWTFRASSAERRLAVRTALRSYTLLELKGCIVKFSFLLTFSAKIVFINKIITIVPLLYCSTKQHPPSLLVKPLVFLCATTCFRAKSVARESNSERKLALEVQWTSNASFVASELPARACLRSARMLVFATQQVLTVSRAILLKFTNQISNRRSQKHYCKATGTFAGVLPGFCR